MNELNEKLAKWRWPEAHSIKCYPDPLVEGYNIEIRVNESSILIDWFTNSLDACFKHLVPRLEKDYWIIIDPPNKTVIIVYGFVQEAEGIGETSALALCRAIEKIIDDA